MNWSNPRDFYLIGVAASGLSGWYASSEEWDRHEFALGPYDGFLEGRRAGDFESMFRVGMTVNGVHYSALFDSRCQDDAVGLVKWETEPVSVEHGSRLNFFLPAGCDELLSTKKLRAYDGAI